MNESTNDHGETLAGIVALMNENVIASQMQGTIMLRQFLTADANEPSAVTAAIASGVLPRVVSFLESPQQKLQFEAAWSLSCVAASDSVSVRALVDAGALPLLTQLMKSPLSSIREHAVLAIGYVASDGKEMHDLVLRSEEITHNLLELFMDLSDESLVRSAVLTVSNLCRFQPPLLFVERCLPVIIFLLRREDDVELAIDLCWSLAYICDCEGDAYVIQSVIRAGALSDLQRSCERNVGATNPSVNLASAVVCCYSNFVLNASIAQFGRLAHCDVVFTLLRIASFGATFVGKHAIVCTDLIVRRANDVTKRSLRAIAEQQSVIDACIAHSEALPDAERRKVAYSALGSCLFSLERPRMIEVCIAMQGFDLPALVVVSILEQLSVGGALAPFHRKWDIATKVKHFKDN